MSKGNELDINNIVNMVNQFIKQEYKIFEGEFESITYYWGGDYEGKTFEEKNGKIIVTRVPENEIIGKLRWFLRTVLARFSPHVSNLNSYKEVDDCLYFLGRTSERRSLKSDYMFRVEVINPGGEVNVKDLERVKLTRKTDKRFLPIDNVKFKLEIYKLKESKGGKECVSADKRDFLVIGGTLLTLAYLGIGKAANRGFGRFYARKVNAKDKNVVELNNEILKGDIVGAFNLYYRTLGFDESKGKDWRGSKIPLAPLTSGTIKDDGIYISDSITNEFKSMSCCNKIVLKSTWKAYWNKNMKDQDLKILALLFGLPRSSVYITNKKIRRVSPIVLSPIKLRNNGYKVAVLPFLSYLDFEELLKKNAVFVTVNNLENYIEGLPNMLSKVCQSNSSKPSTFQQSKGSEGQGK